MGRYDSLLDGGLPGFRMFIIRALEREGGKEFALNASSSMSKKGGSSLSLKVLNISMGSPSGPAAFPLFIAASAISSSESFMGLSRNSWSSIESVGKSRLSRKLVLVILFVLLGSSDL